jgi:hypothetical protein
LSIIDAEQRRRILELYPPEQGPSLAVLAIFWVGGALLFLGIAFLLGIVWNELGHLRVPIVLGLDGAFFAAGFGLLRRQRGLDKTAMALLVIGGLLLPPALGFTYDDLFGSSGHPLPLVALCTAIYVGLTVALRSDAFACLSVLGLFFIGEEALRDDAFNALVPLVQLGLVNSVDDVWPIVFYSLGAFTLLTSWLAGRTATLSHLRSTLWVCGLLLGLLPGLVGALDVWSSRSYHDLRMGMAIVACLGAIVGSVATRERKAFWLSAAALVVALLILFGQYFEDSVAFTCFAIVLGVAILIAASILATRKDTWLDRLFPPDPDRI